MQEKAMAKHSNPAPSPYQLEMAVTLLRQAKYKLIEEEGELGRDEEYQSDVFASDPNTIDAWAMLESTIRASREAAADAEKVEGMIKRLKERKARHEKRAETLKDAAANAMRCMGQWKAPFPEFTMWREEARQRVNVTEPALIPPRYKTVETVETLDLKALLADMKAGTKIDGAELVNGQEIVKIKV
jgi:Siphovirus Gp157